jgi:hypothetical protein
MCWDFSNTQRESMMSSTVGATAGTSAVERVAKELQKIFRRRWQTLLYLSCVNPDGLFLSPSTLQSFRECNSPYPELCGRDKEELVSDAIAILRVMRGIISERLLDIGDHE